MEISPEAHSALTKIVMQYETLYNDLVKGNENKIPKKFLKGFKEALALCPVARNALFKAVSGKDLPGR